MQYLYSTSIQKGPTWTATLCKGDDYPLKRIGGTYKTEAEAVAACKTHHARACKMAANFGRELPTAFYR